MWLPSVGFGFGIAETSQPVGDEVPQRSLKPRVGVASSELEEVGHIQRFGSHFGVMDGRIGLLDAFGQAWRGGIEQAGQTETRSSYPCCCGDSSRASTSRSRS